MMQDYKKSFEQKKHFSEFTSPSIERFHECKTEIEDAHTERKVEMVPDLLKETRSLNTKIIRDFDKNNIVDRVLSTVESETMVVKVVDVGLENSKEQDLEFFFKQILFPATNRPVKPLKGVNINRSIVFRADTGAIEERKILGERGRKKITPFAKKTSYTLVTNPSLSITFKKQVGVMLMVDLRFCILKPYQIFSQNMVTNQKWHIKGVRGYEDVLKNIPNHLACTLLDIQKLQLQNIAEDKMSPQNELLPRVSAAAFVGILAVSREQFGDYKYTKTAVADRLNALYANYVYRQLAHTHPNFGNCLNLWQNFPTYILDPEQKDIIKYTIADQINDLEVAFKRDKDTISYRRAINFSKDISDFAIYAPAVKFFFFMQMATEDAEEFVDDPINIFEAYQNGFPKEKFTYKQNDKLDIILNHPLSISIIEEIKNGKISIAVENFNKIDASHPLKGVLFFYIVKKDASKVWEILEFKLPQENILKVLQKLELPSYERLFLSILRFFNDKTIFAGDGRNAEIWHKIFLRVENSNKSGITQNLNLLDILFKYGASFYARDRAGKILLDHLPEFNLESYLNVLKENHYTLYHDRTINQHIVWSFAFQLKEESWLLTIFRDFCIGKNISILNFVIKVLNKESPYIKLSEFPDVIKFSYSSGIYKNPIFRSFYKNYFCEDFKNGHIKEKIAWGLNGLAKLSRLNKLSSYQSFCEKYFYEEGNIRQSKIDQFRQDFFDLEKGYIKKAIDYKDYETIQHFVSTLLEKKYKKFDIIFFRKLKSTVKYILDSSMPPDYQNNLLPVLLNEFSMVSNKSTLVVLTDILIDTNITSINCQNWLNLVHLDFFDSKDTHSEIKAVTSLEAELIKKIIANALDTDTLMNIRDWIKEYKCQLQSSKKKLQESIIDKINDWLNLKIDARLYLPDRKKATLFEIIYKTLDLPLCPVSLIQEYSEVPDIISLSESLIEQLQILKKEYKEIFEGLQARPDVLKIFEQALHDIKNKVEVCYVNWNTLLFNPPATNNQYRASPLEIIIKLIEGVFIWNTSGFNVWYAFKAESRWGRFWDRSCEPFRLLNFFKVVREEGKRKDKKVQKFVVDLLTLTGNYQMVTINEAFLRHQCSLDRNENLVVPEISLNSFLASHHGEKESVKFLAENEPARFTVYLDVNAFVAHSLLLPFSQSLYFIHISPLFIMQMLTLSSQQHIWPSYSLDLRSEVIKEFMATYFKIKNQRDIEIMYFGTYGYKILMNKKNFNGVCVAATRLAGLFAKYGKKKSVQLCQNRELSSELKIFNQDEHSLLELIELHKMNQLGNPAKTPLLKIFEPFTTNLSQYESHLQAEVNHFIEDYKKNLAQEFAIFSSATVLQKTERFLKRIQSEFLENFISSTKLNISKSFCEDIRTVKKNINDLLKSVELLSDKLKTGEIGIAMHGLSPRSWSFST